MNDPFFPAQLATGVRRTLRPASQLLPLEQRFMFDGAVADAAHAAQAHEAPPPVPPAVTVRAAEPAKDDGKKEVVLVDTSVANYKSLEAGVRAGVGIVEFDGSRDGLAQIAQWAAGQSGIDAIHILSHGSEGKLVLGSTVLSDATLAAPAVQAELADIGHALSADGDLLFYGCDVAAGGGQRFVDDLARLTGADIAASTNATGAAARGGDWTLETHAGRVDADALHIDDYQGLLTVLNFDPGSDSDLTGFDHTSITRTIGGRTFTLLGGNGSGGMGVYSTADTGDASSGIYAYEGFSGGHDVYKLTLRVEAGYMFDLSSFDVTVATGNLTIDLTYADGSSGSATQSGLSTWGTLSSFNASTSHVTQVVLTANDYALYQNFGIINVVAIPAAPTVNDANIAIISTPTGTGGAYRIGDTVTATWTNAAASAVDSATMDFSQFGGGTAVAATNAGGVWTASYTITAGSIDLGNRNVSVTASNVGGHTTTADTTNLSVDNAAPNVTDARISISGGSGTGGAYKIGDTVTATWNDTAGGDNNADTISGVTVDFSQFGGGSAVAAVNAGRVWSASYIITAGSIDLANRNVTIAVTDNAGNAATRTDSSNATVDNIAPTVTDAKVSISGASGTGGAYKVGDTVTATWNNTAAGDNNADTISGVSVDFSQFGGGIAVTATNAGGIWTATYIITSGAIDLTGRNVALSAVDNAGNRTTTADTTGATVDNTAPTATDANLDISGGTGGIYKIGDTVTATWNNTAAGDNNADTVAGVSFDFSQFGGGSAVSATNAGGVWTAAYTITAGALDRIGNRHVAVRVVDNAGNATTTTDSANATVDNVAPQITFSGLTLSADSGINNDFITKEPSQTIGATLSGALAGGDIVYGSLDNGATWTDITSKVSGTALSWTGVTLTGSNTLQLKVTDAAGNDSTPQTKAYQLDTTAPATPGTPDLATASDNGKYNNDNITLDTTPTLSGTAENGSSVALYDGATLLTTVTAGAGGWTYTTGALSQGDHTITAVATDTAGNVSAASAGLTITVDTTAPTVTSVAVPTNGTYGTGGTLDFTVNFDEAVVVDDFGGTPRIAIVVGATTRYANYVSGSGGSALLFRYTVPNGDIDANGITVGALSTNGGLIQDTAGNDIVTTLNSIGSTAGVNVDGTNPGVTGVSASTADGAYGAGATITITVDFSSAVDVDTSGGTPTLALDDGGTATYTGGSGSSTLTFSYTVGAGANSADLDVASTGALTLNGATIIDAAGSHQAADVTLATPGTAGSLGANKDLVIDTTAPGNTVDAASFSADTGTAGDFITKTAAQTVSGTLASNLAADEHVYVSLDNGSSWAMATAVAGTKNWSLAGQTLTGSGTLKVRVGDDAGNVGTAYSQAYVYDTTAPTTTFSGIALSPDTGASNSDLITNTAAQTISATLSAAPAAGDIVYGSLDNGATWTDITSKVSGTTLTWNGVTLAASDTLKLRVTDAAGNDGAATSAAYVLDTTGPATSVSTVAFSADTGTAGDFITRTAAQTVSGTLSANLAAGESVLVSLDNGATWSTASTTVGTNTFTLAGRTLTASDTLLVKVSDDAGNDGNVLSQAYVYDTAATVPTVTAQSTMSLTPVLSGTAALVAGETMTVTVGGATYDVVPVAGAWSLDLATAVPVSGALTLVLNNQYSVTATVTDLAGNTASDATGGELIVGTIALPAPTTGVTGAALSADSGISNSDFITNVAAQTISGTLSAPLAAGESVQVSLDGSISWRSAAASGAGWTLAGATLGNGANQLQVKVSSADGDGPVYTQDYVLDTTPPATPIVDPLAAPTTTPTLTGSATLDSGDRLSVSVGGATYDVAVSGGAWSLNLATATPASGTLALAAGATYEVVATVTDRAGNTRSDAGSNELIIAGVPATVVGGVTLSADTGASNSDFITNVAAQTISGSLSAPLTAGQRVEVSLDGGVTWNNATAAIGSTAWSAGITLSGSNVFMARVSNGSGSGAVSQHAYVLDTVAPVASATSAALSGGNVLGGGLSAPLGAGESVLVSRDGGVTFVTASVNGTSWSLPGAASGTVQVVVRDTAGNNGAVLTVNLGAPGEPPVTPPVQPPVVPPVEPPPPPVLPPPVLTQPPVPVDATPAEPAPADASPLTLPTVLTPGAGLPLAGGPSIITPTVLAPGVPAPDSPANPLAPSLVVLTDARAQLTVFTPNGLPEAPFASDMILANAPIADLVIGSGERISVQLAPDTFTTTSASKAGIELSAQSADGTPIPGWLKFDSRTARFEGTPPAGFEGTLSFKVTARDAQGRVAVQNFKIVVTKDGQAAPVKSSSLDLHFIEPAGRSALSEQMRAARHAGAERLALLSRSAAAAKAQA